MSFQPCQKHDRSPGVQKSKEKPNRFLFAKLQIFRGQLKCYCCIPQGHPLQSEGHSHCLWIVKQMDSTKEKRKEMGRIGKLCFELNLCSVTAIKLVWAQKITLEIMLPFLLLQFTRIWQYSVMTIFQVQWFEAKNTHLRSVFGLVDALAPSNSMY